MLLRSREIQRPSVQAGDCIGVEASKSSVKGKDSSGFNRAFVYNHTHFHHHPGR